MAGLDNAPEVQVVHSPIVVRGSEHRIGAYVAAGLNPPKETFLADVAKAQHTILDIGCGQKPRLSWKLNSLDMWVGCDPSIPKSEGSVSVQRGRYSVSTDANLTVFDSVVGDIPTFTPDILSAVAPNQKDIAEGSIFNDELRKFLSKDKNQTFVIVLDTRTVEAKAYQRDAKLEIYRWMRENGFARDEASVVEDKFKANSADLGEHNIFLVYTRTPKRPQRPLP